MSVHDVGRIQISQNLQFLKREWRFQRFGWLVFALLILLGLSGALGRGPLAMATIGNDVLRIEYERILRHAAISDMKITVGPSAAAADSTFRLYLSADYLARFDVQNILPQPVASGYRGDMAWFEFERTDATRPALIVVHTKPSGYWRVDAQAAVDGGPALHIAQFILP